ncbi:MAG: Gldg family protein [Butyrivibrio sp.]|jgi:ABC-2 type transport system permease protein|nr:Gldg family protein [Butyrivibrio sp.]
MIAIFKREFKSYFHTVIGQLVVSYITLMLFLFFMVDNIASMSASMTYTITGAALFAITLGLPILCMRSFSEERHNKTDQLILTAPVTVGQIVMGKFLALLAIFAIPCAFTCVLPVLMSFFGDVSLLSSYSAILGFFLYGAMVIAICMFISAITESQIISVVISIVVILIGYWLSSLYDNISNSYIKAFFKNTYDFRTRLSNVASGTFDITSVIYFVSVAALFLFLCVQVIQKRRYAFSRKNFSVGAYSGVMIIVMIGVVVFANLISAQIPESYRKIDVTSSGIYSISKESKDVAAGITDDITIYLMAQKDSDYSNYQDATAIIKALNLYCAQNSKIKLEYVDPTVNPQFATKYQDTSTSSSSSSSDPSFSVIVTDTTNNRYKYIAYSDMIVSTVDYSTYQSTVSAFDIEGQITSALQYVTLNSDELLKAYTVTGHNEASLDESFSAILSKYNLSSASLDLSTNTAVPDDCDLLIINQPTVDFTADDAGKVTDYLDKGGKILINTIFNTQATMTNFDTILSYYGVKEDAGLVVETEQNMHLATQQYPGLYLYPSLGSDDITSGISDTAGGHVLYPFAQALTYDSKATGYTYTPLLQSSAKAYLKKDYTQGVDQTSDDPTGQYTIALKVEKTLTSGTSTAIIYTSANAFTSDVNTAVNGTNLKLFGNTLNSLADLDVKMVTIPSKSVTSSLTISAQNSRLILSVGMALVLVILVSGIVTWCIRKKQ